jgi:two-component system chemotaxis response regulator CheY
MRTIVCDDDATVRSIVSNLATKVGLNVLAETDSGPDAVEMGLRFGAELLILDLALPWGAGMDVVRQLREREAPAEIVVFTSWAADSPEVRGSGVKAVIEKPDFEQLETVLQRVAEGGPTVEDAEGEHPDRRPPTEARERFPEPGPASPSGIEDPDSFDEAVLRLQPHDGVLVVHVAVEHGLRGTYPRLVGVDTLLDTARLLRGILRTQDRLSIAEPPSDDRLPELAVAVLGGGRPGVEAVWRRLERAHELAKGPGVLSAGWALVDDVVPGPAALGRATEAAARSIGRPDGERLWAG